MCDCLTPDCSRIRILCVVYAECSRHYDTFRCSQPLRDDELCELHEGKCRDDSAIKNYDTFPCYRFISI